MSQVKIQGNPSGSGTFTIAAPNSNSDRTLNLPDGSGTINTSGAPNEVPAGSASAPAIYPTGDTNTGIFFPAADTIAFAEGGAEIAQFDSGGRFGLGITPSAWSASYKVQQTGFTNTYSLSDYQGGFVRGAFFNGSNWIAQNSFMGMARYMMDENNHYWAIAPGVTSGTTVTWTTAMTVNSSGKLILGVAGQGIQFADGTTQTTAASGVPGSWGAVGTVTMALIPASSITQTIAEGSTVSGSVLQRVTDSAANNENLDAFNTMFTDFNSALAYFRWFYGAQTNLGLTGTWRVLTRARITRTGGSASSLFLPALLQRIS